MNSNLCMLQGLKNKHGTSSSSLAINEGNRQFPECFKVSTLAVKVLVSLMYTGGEVGDGKKIKSAPEGEV